MEQKQILKTGPARGILFQWKVSHFGHLCLLIPLLSLLSCLVFAMKYQFDQVNETVCNVTNLLPSISAITGISPQRYLWRTVMALQCTPRIAIGFAYLTYWNQHITNVPEHKRWMYDLIKKASFVFYMIEVGMAVGTAYISNKDNYPIHEKLFIVFMMACIAYQALTLMLSRMAHPGSSMVNQELKSYRVKYVCFILMIISTASLLFAFYRHRRYCDPSAFTIFAGCEYIIALMDMLYHYTGVIDLRGQMWMISSSMPETKKKHS